jgi:DNA sulfur modification protein DndB
VQRRSASAHRGLPDYFEGAFGILQFSGDEKLFAIDGQHRVVGIKKAVAQSQALDEEEVIALFVPHSRDAAGMERSRRLFTTLNRYAKPVSKMDIIALDEEDIVAIVTRMLVEQYELFKNFVKIKKGKALQVRDSDSFTTIETLYEAMDEYLRDQDPWSDFKRTRPSDTRIRQYYSKAVTLWSAIQERFPAVRELAGSEKGARVAGQFRGPHGGHLLFRPVGLLLVVEVLRRFLDLGMGLSQTLRRIAEVPMDLASEPWTGLLWNPVARRMVTAPENRDVAVKILYYAIGGSLQDLGTSAEEVRREWAGILNRPPSEVSLRRWVQT